MKIINLERSEGIMVEMSTREACDTIASLATQIANQNPNVGRLESQTNKGYFSISVTPDPTKDCNTCQAKMLDRQIANTQKAIRATQKIIRKKENDNSRRTKKVA